MKQTSKADTAPHETCDKALSRLSRAMSRISRLKGPIAAIAAVGGLVGGMAGYWNGWRALHSEIAEASVSPAKVASPVARMSVTDRRMTFAVLPFQSPTSDTDGARMARAAFEVTQSEQEANILWGRVVPRTLVDQQMTRPQTTSQLAQALGAQFLYRGNVTRRGPGYSLELAVIDGDTERVIDQRTVNAEMVAGTLQLPDKAVRALTYGLTYAALRQEVARARAKPDAQLDVRDLAFRAAIDWNSDSPDRAAVYATTMKSLKRALALAPDDLLTLQLTATVNLCECLKAWAADDRPMAEIGVAALDKGLTLRPEWPTMQKLRFWQHFKHRRYEDALLVTDALLAKQPDDEEVLYDRVAVLQAMGEAQQALALVPAMLKGSDDAQTGALAAEVYFANGNDAQAARLARKALVLLTGAQRADSGPGSVALVLVAAESRAGHLDEARRAFKDFQDAVPKAQTVSQIKAWVGPEWLAPGGDALWVALRRAGAGG